MLEKSKSSSPDVSKEIKAMTSLRPNKAIRVLLADEGNCTAVLNEP
jgi:hypothetical protein